MHIAISGAQGVGKTTLINALKEKVNIKFFDGITRDLSKKGFKINEEGDDKTQIKIMETHYLNKRYSGFAIFDRCALDGMVYTHYLFNINKVTRHTFEGCLTLFEEIIDDYIIYYIPPEFDIEDDNERSTNEQFRDDIVDLFKYYIRKYRLDVKELRGSVEERVNIVMEEVDVINKIIEMCRFR